MEALGGKAVVSAFGLHWGSFWDPGFHPTSTSSLIAQGGGSKGRRESGAAGTVAPSALAVVRKINTNPNTQPKPTHPRVTLPFSLRAQLTGPCTCNIQRVWNRSKVVQLAVGAQVALRARWPRPPRASTGASVQCGSVMRVWMHLQLPPRLHGEAAAAPLLVGVQPQHHWPHGGRPMAQGGLGRGQRSRGPPPFKSKSFGCWCPGEGESAPPFAIGRQPNMHAHAHCSTPSHVSAPPQPHPTPSPLSQAVHKVCCNFCLTGACPINGVVLLVAVLHCLPPSTGSWPGSRTMLVWK